MEIIGRLTLVQNKYAVTNKCINFKSKEQEDELISQFPHRNFDSNIFMQDGDTILVPLNYEECIKYNYCYFNNRINDLEKKRYFCYITNYEYVEPNVTRIGIAVDTLQTFLFDIDKFRGNMERCHSARRINVGTEETPRYIINPDLYFMEDEVDVYKPVVTEKAPNPHQTYIVLTFAIPSTYNSTGGNYDAVEGFVNPLGLYRDKATSIAVRDKDTNIPETMSITSYINFPQSSNYKIDISGVSTVDHNVIERYNYTTKDIGDTSIYTIILPTAPTSGKTIDFLPYETFKECFPLLQDKLVDSFYVDNISTEDITYTMEIKTGVGEISTTYKYYAVPYSRLQALKTIVTLDKNNELNPDKWVNRVEDTSILRKIEQEKKLDLYPYSFVKISSMGCELVWKYQEYYKILNDYSDNCYSYVKAFNVISPNYKMLSTLLFDKENLIKYDETTFNELMSAGSVTICNYYCNLEPQELLPSLSIYQEKYTEYLNYQKAIVDANNTMNFFGGAVKGALGVGSAISGAKHDIDIENASYRYHYASMEENKNRFTRLHNAKVGGIKAGAGFGIAGAVAGALEGVSGFITTALQEQALKKQPMNVLHRGTSSDKFFSTLYDYNGNIHDYIITKYEPIDNIKSIYEQKFYNYGYKIPVDVELDKEEFFEIINNRKYFCYMEWNSLEIESYIPTIYINDIVARLRSGVRFENTSKQLLFQTYTTTLNNKETSIPAKPFFVRNY